jgi:L-iditol 2-dehydrogenase
MRAAVYHGIGDIRLREIPEPHPNVGEALLRVNAAGICGTDLRIFLSGHHRISKGDLRVLGHEVVGEIVEVGEGVNLASGERVVVAPNIGCGSCPMCASGWANLCPDYEAFGVTLDGGFEEYMLITAKAIQQGNVVVIPSSVSDQVAVLAEPLSCCINGQEAVEVSAGDAVLIMGAGPVGLIHLVLAKVKGAEQVIVSEPIIERLQSAQAFGADALIDPKNEDLYQAVREATGGSGADVIISATSSPEAQQQALELVRPLGRINYFGGLPPGVHQVCLKTNLIHYKQVVVTGTTGSNVRHFRAAVDLIVTGRIQLEDLISQVLPLERIWEGFKGSGSGDELRILVDPRIRTDTRPSTGNNQSI